MTVIFKPYLKDTDTFASGQIVYPTPEITIDDWIIKSFSDITHTVSDLYEDKYTGFETTKYDVKDNSIHDFEFTFTGDLPRWAVEQIRRMAISINGAGLAVYYYDTIFDAAGDGYTYYTRWINAGDFQDNSEIRSGAKMVLRGFVENDIVVVTDYQKMIEVQPLEWDLQLSHTTEYVRII